MPGSTNSPPDMGVMLTFQNPPASGRSAGEVDSALLDQAVRAEELGFDTIWITEHHFFEDGYIPSPLVVAGAIAARTTRVRIGTAVAIPAFNDAVRFTEDATVVDVLSGGRFDLGLGQGYAPAEFEKFGVPASDRLSRFLEFSEIVSKLWTSDDCTFDGKHFSVRNATLMPKPVQTPHPPIWIGARARVTIRRAAANGFHLISGGEPAQTQIYDAALREVGHEPREFNVGQIAWVHVSETDDQAWENAAHGYEYVLRGYGPGLVVSGEFKGYNLMGNIEGAHQIRTAYEASIARGEPPLLQAIFGSPETVAGALQTVLDTCRTTHLVLSMHLPGLDVRLAERSMELFMSDVKPQLSNGGPHATSEQRDR